MAMVLFLPFAITLVIALTDETMSSEQQSNSIAFTSFLAIVGMLFLVIDREPEKMKAWNDLPFEEQCRLTAIDLKMGRRSWFLNPLTAEEGGGFHAVPLSSENMNEYGGGIHIITTEKKITKLMLDGEIKNPELVNGILTHL